MHGKYIYAALLTLLPDKKETAYHYLLTLLENLFFVVAKKIMKYDFEAAVASEINTVRSDSIVTCCNFHFSQCLWRQLQNIGLTLAYKEHE